ncbi:MAG: hypothetical protein J6Q63_04120 [Bacteroidales bacterium]|nr:hypothetical protein [Bacteroidales bacterium]
MKKFLYGLLSILMLSMVSCKEPEPQVEDPKPQINIEEGLVTENSIEFFLSATEADEVAYHFMETTDEVPLLTVEGLFKGENVFTASAEPVSFVMENLKPETEYTVYAAASKEGKYFSEIKELTINTAEKPKLLQFISKSKTGFSYKVNAEEGQQYFHTYLEGWYFEYMLESAKYEDGAEFDEKVFIWNLLADHGIFDESAKEFEWYTGKENPMRGDVAFIVPGTRYYVLTALWNEDMGGWIEKPEVIGFDLEEPGTSSSTVDCSIDGLSPYSVSIRMEMDSDQVSFYMWDFFEKSQYKSYVAENGIEGIMAYVSEYALGKGQAKVNTYTDTWSVDPGTSYMLCVYGVDHNGDEFYTELEVDVPMPDAKIHLSMEPYERELEGYNTYNTFKVYAEYADFVDLDYASSAFYLAGGPIEKAAFDAMVEAVGLSGTLEELEAQGEMLYALGQANFGLNPVSVDEEVLAALNDRGFFNKIYTGLNPDTEYVYMVMAHYDGKMMCRLATAKTDPAPVDVTESEAYKAFLGNWDVTGMDTQNWDNKNEKTFHLTIDRLTSNRSYKIYGWSTGTLGDQFPFEAGFDEASGKMTISTPQTLGEVEIEGKIYEVRFVGKARNKYDPDNFMVLYDYEGLAYKVTMNDPYLHFNSEFFQYAGEWVDFKSLSYVFYDKETKEYFKAEPYDLTQFRVKRVN